MRNQVMSWSLRISDGDLVLDGESFGVVTNENKLVQDFRHYLLSHMGEDTDYPTYGSLIDGGTKPNGQYVESVITETDWATAQLRIEAEIRRVGSQYQRQQIFRAQSDRNKYNRSTLSLGEILAEITNITFQQNADQMTIFITLKSGRNNPAVIDMSIGGL